MNHKPMSHAEMQRRSAGPYISLAVQMLVGGIIMYLVMFAMIDRIDSFYNNPNMLYMALMMVAPMAPLMIVGMPHMFGSKGANLAIFVVSALVFVGAFAMIRQQTLIGDRAFLRSMIPHHSGAILMCGKAKLHDPQFQQLCRRIIVSQREEIDQMTAMLNHGPRP